ncbi:MAG: hypothetical protein QOC96_1710 [Acidobacteriota bacterium]|jgi:hypothetical protein|nr:hypothetical protein [Acidobacteriota bacterium]
MNILLCAADQSTSQTKLSVTMSKTTTMWEKLSWDIPATRCLVCGSKERERQRKEPTRNTACPIL